ncbi:MAG: hypothetical protein UGF45_13610, partial [Massilioclostridium sp.]|nr:hypothetical protein [Massilioclostridium sp.]
ILFQSTAPVGVPTTKDLIQANQDYNFNPRHPWGCRQQNSTRKWCKKLVFLCDLQKNIKSFIGA